MSQANAERRFSPDSAPSAGFCDGQSSSAKNLPMHFRIRAAQLKDLNQIVSVLLHSFYRHAKATQWLYWILRISIQEDIKAKVRAPNDQYACLVATTIDPNSAQSDTVIGTAEMSQRPCETWQFFPPQRAYLSNLAISVSHRRQGAARQLMDTCEKIAGGWGFRHIYLHVMADNIAARALYAQAGYELREVSNPVLSAVGLSPQRLLLSKRISIQVTSSASDKQ
ncbi:MAG: GNAT family N-acetyltransferase [Cyanobacteria bacterium P01_D01_bin.105]